MWLLWIFDEEKQRPLPIYIGRRSRLDVSTQIDEIMRAIDFLSAKRSLAYQYSRDRVELWTVNAVVECVRHPTQSLGAMESDWNCNHHLLLKIEHVTPDTSLPPTIWVQMLSSGLWNLPVAIISLILFFIITYRRKLRSSNRSRRRAIFKALGIKETPNSRIVGYFHPYWWVHWKIPLI